MRLDKLCSFYIVQLHSYLHGSWYINVLLLLLLLLGKSLWNVCKQGHNPDVYALQAAQSCTDAKWKHASSLCSSSSPPSSTGNRSS